MFRLTIARTLPLASCILPTLLILPACDQGSSGGAGGAGNGGEVGSTGERQGLPGGAGGAGSSGPTGGAASGGAGASGRGDAAVMGGAGGVGGSTGLGGNSAGSGGRGSGGATTGAGGKTVGSGGATTATGGIAGSSGGQTGKGGATGGKGGTLGGGGTVGGAGGAVIDGGAGGITGGSCPTGGWTAGKQTIKTQWGGVDRQYVVYVPQGYTGTTPVPLMLVIHGAHNTPAMAETWSQMDTVSKDNGFIVVYPAGLDCWNAGGILGGWTAADDDLGFLKNVVTEVGSHACIDPKQVYATGISNGAMMAQYLGCKAADVLAAVGGVAGPAGQCSPSRPISVFYVHGTEDKTVPHSSAQPNVTGWANRDGCSSTPIETYSKGSTRCVTYEGCKDGVKVVFCTVTGMGHCWPEDTQCGPGGGAQYGVSDFKASPMMWDFFKTHPLP